MIELRFPLISLSHQVVCIIELCVKGGVLERESEERTAYTIIIMVFWFDMSEENV